MTHTPSGEEPFSLASMTPPRRRRTGLLIASISVGALLLIGAAGAIGFTLAGRTDDPRPLAETSAAGSKPATAAATNSSGGGAAAPVSARTACEKLATLSTALPNDVFTVGDLTAIKSVATQAAAADSASITIAGKLLLDTVEDASIAAGRDDEAERMDSVKKYVRNLRKSCAIAGFPT